MLLNAAISMDVELGLLRSAGWVGLQANHSLTLTHFLKLPFSLSLSPLSVDAQHTRFLIIGIHCFYLPNFFFEKDVKFDRI